MREPRVPHKKPSIRSLLNNLDTSTGLSHRLVSLGLRTRPPRHHVAVTGASPSLGSFGDEGLEAGAAEALRLHGATSFAVGRHSELSMSLTRLSRDMTLKRVPEMRAALRDVSHLSLLGADALDGRYGLHGSLNRIRLARTAAVANVSASITSFSFNGTPTGLLATELQRAAAAGVRFSPRDLETADRLDAIIGDSVAPASPDLAFLAPPQAIALDVPDGAIGFNLSRTAILLTGRDFSGTISDVANNLGRLLKDDVVPAVVLIPHDTRGTPSDVDIARETFRLLQGWGLASRAIVAAPMTYGEVKGLSAQLSAIISCRMHLTIAGLSTGVPSASLSYQGKVDGMYSLLGLAVNSFQMESLLNYDQLKELVHSTLDQSGVTPESARRWRESARGHATVMLTTDMPS